MRFFLLSLSVLFATSLFACLSVCIQAGAWRGDVFPGLAKKLWVSTLFLLATSMGFESGRYQIRLNHRRGLRWTLLFTCALGLGFLTNQTRLWWTLADVQLPPTPKTLYAFSFAVLTGVHAIHVLGGFIPLTFCIIGAFRERYSSFDHTPVTYCAMYWHFLDVVWLVIVSVMLLLP